MQAKRKWKPFSAAELEHICKVLADTYSGLTGSEIGYILQQIGVEDTDPSMTKWKRLFNALVARQNADQDADRVLAFINQALQPARYVHNREFYQSRLESVNIILAFHGLQYREDGNFHTIVKASNLTDAESRASMLKQSLLNRRLHPELLRFCKAELVVDNYFHAVLEACKSIAETIRRITGLTSDGATLIDDALGGDQPRIKINQFSTETEKSEQRGFVNLAKGLFGTFRNPTAHAPKIEWPLSEEDALDMFTLASYVLRRIDNRIQ